MVFFIIVVVMCYCYDCAHLQQQHLVSMLIVIYHSSKIIVCQSCINQERNHKSTINQSSILCIISIIDPLSIDHHQSTS